MTREDRAQRWLVDYFEHNGHRRRAGALRDGRIISMNNITVAGIMLAFADAEAAAMRERAADYLEGYAGGHHMAKSCAAAIRALPATGEVGRVG